MEWRNIYIIHTANLGSPDAVYVLGREQGRFNLAHKGVEESDKGIEVSGNGKRIGANFKGVKKVCKKIFILIL